MRGLGERGSKGCRGREARWRAVGVRMRARARGSSPVLTHLCVLCVRWAADRFLRLAGGRALADAERWADVDTFFVRKRVVGRREEGRESHGAGQGQNGSEERKERERDGAEIGTGWVWTDADTRHSIWRACSVCVPAQRPPALPPKSHLASRRCRPVAARCVCAQEPLVSESERERGGENGAPGWPDASPSSGGRQPSKGVGFLSSHGSRGAAAAEEEGTGGRMEMVRARAQRGVARSAGPAGRVAVWLASRLRCAVLRGACQFGARHTQW